MKALRSPYYALRRRLIKPLRRGKTTLTLNGKLNRGKPSIPSYAALFTLASPACHRSRMPSGSVQWATSRFCRFIEWQRYRDLSPRNDASPPRLRRLAFSSLGAA
ncbi:hypothetical protein MRX96_029456 [Rhipicephalus microplus]